MWRCVIWVALFLCMTLLSFANPYIKKMPYTDTAFLALKECAFGKDRACSTLLQKGYQSVEECRPYTCYLIGLVLSANKQDIKALSYLSSSCYADEKLGCALLGLLYDFKGKQKEAGDAYNRACMHGDVLGCYNLGVLQAKEGKESFALESFKEACKKHYAKACFNLAVLHANSKHDKERARYFFSIGCDYGMLESCANAKKLQDLGVGMPLLQKRRGLYVWGDLEE